MLPHRTLNVAIAALGSVRRPRVALKTLESGLVADKLVWAGNCYLDFATLGLDDTIATRIAAVGALTDPTDRLRSSLELIPEWQALSVAEPAHQAFYVTNTLLRWSVLSYLTATAKPATWFFGRDNLGLGLEFELYVHNFVRSNRVAFLEFGGKTSETALYPRALHLLARDLYVIAIVEPDNVHAILERIRRGLEHPRDFFADLEQRRRRSYASFETQATLREAQDRLWATSRARPTSSRAATRGRRARARWKTERRSLRAGLWSTRAGAGSCSRSVGSSRSWP